MSDSVTEPKRMKLFVVGEVSADPGEWQSEHRLVIAESVEHARQLTDIKSPIVEVSMSLATVLI